MCGIVGIRRFDGVMIDKTILSVMTNQLIHRGPDEEGYWIDGSVGFGHRRLSIIDPKGSHQPMGVQSIQVCFNGEIFNYRELRNQLIGSGYEFVTGGDTEVLLALFLKKGPEGIKLLNGQYSYAIYNGEEKELWLFRDRLGILPLYYYCDAKKFIFASEIKGLFPAISNNIEIDFDSLDEYLASRSVSFPNTLYKGIKKLPPGNMLRVDSCGNINIQSYWNLPYKNSINNMNKIEAVELVSNRLGEAVKTRMIADVPIGAFLSGGVDSSLIVALMSNHGEGSPVKTFSAGFGDPRYDELPFARLVSKQFNTDHHEISVLPEDFLNLWYKLTWHRDAPISEPADMAIFKIATLARETVKVLLSGEGSDEIFAGYPKYKNAKVAAWADSLPPALRKHLFKQLERLLPEKYNRLRIMMRAMSASNEAERFQTWFAPFTKYERDLLFPNKTRYGYVDIWKKAEGDVIRRMLYFDCHTWLVDNLLERGDKMAMAASVEYRPPFLDHHLVELAFNLPSSMKVHNGTTKWIVKEVARKYLPSIIVDRKKVGFRVPLDLWFRGKLKEVAYDLLLSSNSFVSHNMNRQYIRDMMERHEKGRSNEEIRIWTLLCLEIWHKVFIKIMKPSLPI